MENKKWNIEFRIGNIESKTRGSFSPKFSSPYPISHIPYSTKRGIATLPTVMLLGIMILAVAVSITAVSLTESYISQGSGQSAQALFYAEAGARDALVRIARNKSYVCSSTDCYTIDFTTNGCATAGGCATVSVSTGAGSVGDSKIITSKGTMKTSTRTLNVSVVLDSLGNGLITGTTWSEVTS